MHALSLYLRYAFRSFLRGRTRSLFGAFCVAVGIASVVGLGLAGGNFQDAVTGNAQKMNRGDVSIAAPGYQGFSLKDYRHFAALRAQGKIVDYTSVLRADAMLKSPGGDQSNIVVGSLDAVDGQKFPFYDSIKADQPAGVPLARLLAHPQDTVVSHDVFDTLHLRIGDRLKVVFRFGGTRTFTVTGVVPNNAPDPAFGGGLFPQFVMVDRSSMEWFARAIDVGASQVYMKTRDAAQANAVKAELERYFGGAANPKTVADVEKESRDSAAGFDKFFSVMSLVAVVIGGIGIVNTMLVAARRRMREIAVLKSIGMKGRQVVLIFTLESLLLAIAGTAVGIILGLLASIAVSGATENLAGFPIPWSLHPRPLIAGAVVGIVATVLFAYLPVVRASRTRPIAALRDELGDGGRRRVRAFLRSLRARPLATIAAAIRRLPRGIIGLPKRQGLRTALLVLVLAALMGYLAVLYAGLASGAQTVMYGLMIGIGTLVAAGVLTQVFVALVWLVSKLPSMGRLSVRMAFRSMGTQRRRMASTLLALCIGILAIGSIAIMAQNIKQDMAQYLEQQSNFNVYLQAPHNTSTLRSIDAKIAALPGIQHREDGAVANNLALVSADGRSLSSLIHRALTGQGGHKVSKDDVSQALGSIKGVEGHDVLSPNQYKMDRGRNLDIRDLGTNHVVVRNDYAKAFGITLGSHLVFAEGSHRAPFTVVGIVNPNALMVTASTEADVRYLQRVGLTSPSPSHDALIFLRIRHANVQADVSTLRRALPGVLVFDLSDFLQFAKAIDKLALFPEIIGGLALFAGAIIIANTVALAMLERRREIGVMKAVGAKRRTILQHLLVENAIVGLLGSLAGVLLAMLATAIIDTNLFQIPATYDWLTVGALVLLGTALAVGASALTALPASGEKPMRVLRYE